MAESDSITFEAKVIKALPNAQFIVEADTGSGKHEVLAHIAGKMRKHFIRIVPGDTVTVLGFDENGNFQAGQITNESTGEILLLRDPNGRPLWAGRGQGGGQGQGQPGRPPVG